MKLQIKKLDDSAIIPSRGSEHAAGLDLYCSEQVALEPLTRKLVKTGISVSIPSGHYGRIAPRSGLAFKNGIDVLAGVVDSDYRGEIMVLLLNTDSENSIEFQKGDRIAQLIIEAYGHFDVEEVETLEDSVRGIGGFGSTGL